MSVKCLYEKFDSEGRVVEAAYSNGWAFTRKFDDDWDDEIPSEVVETSFGTVVYERYYTREKKYVDGEVVEQECPISGINIGTKL